MKKLEGKITISRISSNIAGDYMQIKIEDKLSGCRVISVEVNTVEFMNALTNFAYRPCKLQLYENYPIGKTREVKKEVIVLDEGWISEDNEKKIIAEEAARPFEIDGWKLHHWNEAWNHHNIVKSEKGKRYVSVGFIRFVEGE